MSKRQVLIPSIVFDRIRSRLEALPHEIDVLCWTSSGVQLPDGSPVETTDYKPEIAWIPIDLLFAGTSNGMTVSEFLLFTEAITELFIALVFALIYHFTAMFFSENLLAGKAIIKDI